MKFIYDGVEIPTTTIDMPNDIEMPDSVFSQRDPSKVLEYIIAEQNLTLDVGFYQGMKLVNMLRKHSPKKAKQLQNMLVNSNPLKKVGLI